MRGKTSTAKSPAVRGRGDATSRCLPRVRSALKENVKKAYYSGSEALVGHRATLRQGRPKWARRFHSGRKAPGCSLGNNFFYQAEDGIRDGRVTGVQTCALPI